ncbi:MAG: suppressor of fused domain protein, partial [Microthrixaceae bacterium]|nr:suppressor of fused domain protein [Microthrixaceae bacterium]
EVQPWPRSQAAMRCEPEGDVIAHMESFLGPIDGGWSKTEAGERLPFTVLRFSGAPIPGTATFVTLGLSDVALALPGRQLVRQEFLVSTYDRFHSASIVTALHDVAVDAARRGDALLRGSVCAGPFGLPGVVTDLYCAIPVFFPDSFHVWRGSDPPTVFVWLVPITTEEHRFVEEKGWESFEQILESQDPDLLDLSRLGLSLQ